MMEPKDNGGAVLAGALSDTASSLFHDLIISIHLEISSVALIGSLKISQTSHGCNII